MQPEDDIVGGDRLQVKEGLDVLERRQHLVVGKVLFFLLFFSFCLATFLKYPKFRTLLRADPE